MSRGVSMLRATVGVCGARSVGAAVPVRLLQRGQAPQEAICQTSERRRGSGRERFEIVQRLAVEGADVVICTI